MMLDIETLTITQEGFRNEGQITSMISFVATGGMFDEPTLRAHSLGKDTRPISIVRFEDGRLFIHDGHHRVAALYLGGRQYVHESEYTITEWKYSDYTDINFDKRWITPFDPRSEIRVNDYEEYKRYIWSQHVTFGPKVAEEVIRKHKNWYVLPRRALTVQDMLNAL